MAAIDFPKPTDTNPDTGNSYADGWYNAANGVTYVYASNTWSAATVSSALDDRYVEVSGDTMTGNLALSDTITLEATSGIGQFSDYVQTRNIQVGDAVYVGANVDIRKDNLPAENAFAIYSGSYSQADEVASITGEGFATFDGGVVTENGIPQL